MAHGVPVPRRHISSRTEGRASPRGSSIPRLAANRSASGREANAAGPPPDRCAELRGMNIDRRPAVDPATRPSPRLQRRTKAVRVAKGRGDRSDGIDAPELQRPAQCITSSTSAPRFVRPANTSKGSPPDGFRTRRGCAPQTHSDQPGTETTPGISALLEKPRGGTFSRTSGASPGSFRMACPRSPR